jgi:tRNA wybutosine-synthesizing protein 4
VDVDYKDLMLKKRTIVQSTNELNSLLTNVRVSDGDILMQSDEYIQLGCDLKDLLSFTRILASAVDIKNCFVLFTAEVSITYMTAEGADALIHWAASLPEGRHLSKHSSTILTKP